MLINPRNAGQQRHMAAINGALAVRGKTLPDFAKEFGAVTWGQFFLKYLLGHSAVNAVMPGTDKVEYMLDNLDAGRGLLPDAAMRRRMAAHIDTLL